MARYRVTVENMVTGEQRIKECEGYLLCTFYDAVELEDGKSVYARADIGASNINQVDVMALMSNENTLGEAFHALNDVLCNPLRKAWWERACRAEVKKS